MEDTGFTEIFLKRVEFTDNPITFRIDGRWLARNRGHKIIVPNYFLPKIDESEVYPPSGKEKTKYCPYEKIRPASEDEYERQF